MRFKFCLGMRTHFGQVGQSRLREERHLRQPLRFLVPPILPLDPIHLVHHTTIRVHRRVCSGPAMDVERLVVGRCDGHTANGGCLGRRVGRTGEGWARL
ncbi:hypothetical protein BDV98DRAFT_572092 [Pterulicium gracile]|uniref:Uncharacterized protein n=1 Tax=Pterulicium gracile TaxID=1884261 RepID=A0A5C3QAG2_9AGAR|nr:hypothetical protein BDV98DRAFT_572092 [Pterula gracilis]